MLQSAVANAENNHSLDVDRLLCCRSNCREICCYETFHGGKGRGRAGRIEKFSVT